jgi:small subunit ribosomal protein S3
MAQKINPHTFRLGINVPWTSRWFYKKSMRFFLEEDQVIREVVMEKILQAGIASVVIERTSNALRVIINASRPGLIIGRGGKGIEELKDHVVRCVKQLRARRKVTGPVNLNLSVEELKRTDISATVTAQQIAFDLEKRQPYRKVMKRTMENIMQNHGVKGAKIKLSGRLNGAEISRHDFLAKGMMPLQTLRANIDYGTATAYNSYGTVGVKVWIYKGEIFEDKAKAPNRNQ